MGASGSKIEEDKALQLCRERKKFVRQALDGRCSLAAAHVTYIQSLKSTGNALRRFVEPEALVESSLYTSTNATPEPRILTEKSPSQSFSSPSRVDATETFSPSPSPPSSRRFHVNHMKFRGFSSKKVEERPPEVVTATVISSNTPENTTPRANEKPESSSFEADSLPQETSPWDYFGLFHPINHQFSFQEEKELNQGMENFDDARQLREHEGIPDLEDEDKASFHEREDSRDSEDEFDEPSTETLVRSFQNFNRVNEHNKTVSASPAMPSARSVASETEFTNEEKSNFPHRVHAHNAVSASPALRSARSVDSEFEFMNGEKSSSSFRLHEHNAVGASPAMRSARSVASETEFMNGEKNNSSFRLHDHNTVGASPAMRSARSVASETEFMNGEKSNSSFRLHEHNAVSASPAIRSTRSVAIETELMNGDKSYSPHLSPFTASSSYVNGPTDGKKTPVKDDSAGNKVAPKDLFSSMKDIEFLFIKASDSGKEVPRMLEANKLHFRPIFPGRESGSKASMFLNACFSCGEDPSHLKEEPPQNSMKYLTWHRTTSSRSSSSANHPMGLTAKDDVEELTNNLFNNICMISGSHASTLDRLYAWERKLYDEVKAGEAVRGDYDQKCKELRQLESTGIRTDRKIDKTRSVVKDLHSRIRVALYRIDSISKRIEELRDKELQPQLEELIEGLSRMWEVMHECHKRQFEIISAAFRHSNMKISVQSESHRQITAYLENELRSLSSSFTKWTAAQQAYMRAINSWLFKCVTIPKETSKKKRAWDNRPHWRNTGPPIYVTVGVWLEKLEALPTKPVSDSIKGLASEISHYLPHQEKTQGKNLTHLSSTVWKGDPNSDSGVNLLRDDMSEDWNPGSDRFQSSLVKFLGQLNKFADSSVELYAKLDESIKNAKNSYNARSANDPRTVPVS